MPSEYPCILETEFLSELLCLAGYKKIQEKRGKR